jgi:DNA-binding NarL/FixJ family response regulator
MTEPMSLRVVIVDDHAMVRTSLRFALLDAHDIDVVGEAADGAEALRICGDLHPDLVLMDLRLPGVDSPATIRALQGQEEPVPQVLVYTAEYDERLIAETLAAGACGYVLKQGEFMELLEAIRVAHARQQAKA